jgi:hypothetical protein
VSNSGISACLRSGDPTGDHLLAREGSLETWACIQSYESRLTRLEHSWVMLAGMLVKARVDAARLRLRRPLPAVLSLGLLMALTG